MKWYAHTNDILRMGPYKTQAEASRAVMSNEHSYGCEAAHWPFTAKCECHSHPADGAFVWPEVETPKRRPARRSRRQVRG